MQFQFQAWTSYLGANRRNGEFGPSPGHYLKTLESIPNWIYKQADYCKEHLVFNKCSTERMQEVFHEILRGCLDPFMMGTEGEGRTGSFCCRSTTYVQTMD